MPALSHQIPAPRKAHLLEQAQQYAGELAAAEVGRNEWLRVLDIVEAHPKLEEARDLVQRLPGSWVSSRSRKGPKQWQQVARTFDSVVQHRLPDVELRFLLGWTARILLVKEKELAEARRKKQKQEFVRDHD